MLVGILDALQYILFYFCNYNHTFNYTLFAILIINYRIVITKSMFRFIASDEVRKPNLLIWQMT